MILGVPMNNELLENQKRQRGNSANVTSTRNSLFVLYEAT